MILEDLFARLDQLHRCSITLERRADGIRSGALATAAPGDNWRCQLFVSGDGYGEGVGRDAAEAIEGALDDLDQHSGGTK